MAVAERRKEIGILLTLGMKPGGAGTLFFWESFLLGLAGGFVGTGLASLVNLYLIRHGLDYSQILQDFDAGFRAAADNIYHGLWNGPLFAVTPWFCALFSDFSALGALGPPCRFRVSNPKISSKQGVSLWSTESSSASSVPFGSPRAI